ncbi:MAG: hypothetical protein WC509_03575 [Candidatus Izemoplasmatales bacterium]
MTKKIAIFLSIALFAFAAVACDETTLDSKSTTATTTEFAVDVRAVVAASADELDEIVADLGGEQKTETAAYFPRRLVADDPGILTPEEYHEVYDTQRDNSTDVALCEEYVIYAELTRSIEAELEANPLLGIGVEFTLDIESIGIRTITLSAVDGYVLVKMTEIIEIEDEADVVITTVMRMGFDEADRFVFDNFITSTETGIGEYNYSGFVENERFLLINHFIDGGYDFLVVSDVDDEELAITVNDGGGEGAETAERYEFVCWRDSETDRRTSITFADGVAVSEYYEFFNAHGIWLMYRVPALDDPDEVSVWWSLLDADGWDYVYDEPSNDSYSMEVELYKDDARMFADGSAIVRGYLSVFTCLYLVIEAEPAYFTEEVLNLSAFGLTFNHPEITPEALEAVRAADIAAAPDAAVYMDVDLLQATAEELAGFVPAILFDALGD